MNRISKSSQAKLQIMMEIARLQLQTGDKLPSERRLAEQFSMSTIPLRHALGELETSGYVVKKHGSGSYLNKPLNLWRQEENVLYIYAYRMSSEPGPHHHYVQKYLEERNIGVKFYAANHPDDIVTRLAGECVGLLVDGLISQEWLDFMHLFNMPTVICSNSIYKHEFSEIGYDWAEAAYQLTMACIRNGRKKIGLLNGSLDYTPAILIQRGYEAAMKAAGIKVNSSLISHSAKSNSYDEVASLLTEEPDLDALVFEPGKLLPYYTYCWNNNCLDRSVQLAVIGLTPQMNQMLQRADSNILYAGFPDDIEQLSVHQLFEQLTDPCKKSTKKLIKPIYNFKINPSQEKML